MYDPRLIGTWRSDKRKTLVEIATRRDLRSVKKKKLADLFGKLKLRYTRTRCYSRFETYKSVSKYEVVAKDDYGVVIVGVTPEVGKQIWHIHFERNRYWIYLGSSGIREFFRRVPGK
jgi:hypothetical protein